MIDQADVRAVEDALPALREWANKSRPSDAELIIGAIERMVKHCAPEKPIFKETNFVAQCPVCKRRVRAGVPGFMKVQEKHCHDCGQTLNWDEINEKWDKYYEHHPNPRDGYKGS